MAVTDKSFLALIDGARRNDDAKRVAKLVGAFDAVGGLSDEALYEVAELLVHKMWIEGSTAYWGNQQIWAALAAFPDRALTALCHVMVEATEDLPDAHQSAATFLFSVFDGKGRAAYLVPSKGNIALLRQRCVALGELVRCPELPDPRYAKGLNKLAKKSPALGAQVKETVLACLDGLQTSRAVDRGLVFWLAVNGVAAASKKVTKKKVTKKKVAKKKVAKSRRS